MYLLGKCKKCGGTTIFDVAEYSQKEVERMMKKNDFGHCQAGGWHVELGKMSDYYILDWSTLTDNLEKLKGDIKNAS
jgi:hypothetical protein